MTENFPNLGQETDIQVPEAQRVPSKRNSQDLLYLKVKNKEDNFEGSKRETE